MEVDLSTGSSTALADCRTSAIALTIVLEKFAGKNAERHLRDLDAEFFSVVAIELVQSCECGRMTKPTRKCSYVRFENDVQRISGVKRARSPAVTGSS